MSDEKQLCDEIKELTKSLNFKIGEAHNIGLRVDVEQTLSRDIQKKFDRPILFVSVFRKL